MGEDDLKVDRTDERTGDLEGDLELLDVLEDWHSVKVVLRKHILLLRLTSEDDAEEEALSGVVDLQSGCKLQCLPQAAKAFTVWVAGRSITLKAETAEEATTWVQAIQSAMLPSGSCVDEVRPPEETTGLPEKAEETTGPPEKTAEPSEEATKRMTEERPEQEAKAPVPAPALENRSNQEVLHRTPNRTPKTGNDRGGVHFVGAYNGGPRSASGSRGGSERRVARREKENIMPPQPGPSMREAITAESLEEATVQVVKKGASAIAEERSTSALESGVGESKVEDSTTGLREADETANSSSELGQVGASLTSEPSVQQIIEKSSITLSRCDSAASRRSSKSGKSDHHWEESLKLFDEVEEMRMEHSRRGSCTQKACCILQ